MSITLTTPTDVTITGPNPVNETDSIGACMGFTVDFFSGTCTFIFRTGQLSGGNLNPGTFGPTVVVTLNLLTGAWSSDNGHSGTVSASQLNSQFKSDRNLVEVFAAGASGIMPGTQVPWT